MTDREPMPDKLRSLALAAQKRLQRLPAVGGVASESVGEFPAIGNGNPDYLRSPYAEQDWELWVCLILDVFGTRSTNVARVFMRQLALLCPIVWNGETSCVDPFAFEQAMSIVKSLKPRNEAEAACAAQAVAVHFASMKVGEHIGSGSYVDSRSASSLAQLGKAFAKQIETLSALRNGGRQKRQIIKVEKNVSVTHYHDEKHVHLPEEGGGSFDGQAHATRAQRAHATRPDESVERLPLPGSDAERDGVPVTSGEGQEGLPDAWRGERIGSAEGDAERQLSSRRIHG